MPVGIPPNKIAAPVSVANRMRGVSFLIGVLATLFVLMAGGMVFSGPASEIRGPSVGDGAIL